MDLANVNKKFLSYAEYMPKRNPNKKISGS